MAKKRTITGTAAVSAAALASLVGAGSASADECVICEPPTGGRPAGLPGEGGRAAALGKVEAVLGKEIVFGKIQSVFLKIDLNLAEIFSKD